jgi:hypothetical protein
VSPGACPADLLVIKDNFRIPSGIVISTRAVFATAMCIQMRLATGVWESDLGASLEGEPRDSIEVNVDFGIKCDGLNCGPLQMSQR